MLARHFLSKKVRVSNSVLKSNVVGSVVRPIRVSNLFSKQYSIFNRKPNWTSSRGCSRFMRVNMSTNFNSARGFSTTEKPEEKLEPKAEQKFERQKDQSIEDFLRARREHERKERKALPGRGPKIVAKLKSVGRDYKEVYENIKQKEFKVMVWKIKEFMSRNYKKFKLLMKHAWHEIKIIGKGFVTLKEDLSYSIRTTKDTAFDEYGFYSFESRLRIRRTWSDLFKFIPFSLFIIVPGLELLLPAWLVIFPNSIPSQFISEAIKKLKMDELVKKQEMSSKKLIILIPKMLSDMTKDSEIDPEDQDKIKMLKTLIKDPNMSITSLLEYRDLFSKYIDFRNFPTSSLEACCSFMSLQPMTARVSWLSKYFLHREIKMYMK